MSTTADEIETTRFKSVGNTTTRQMSESIKVFAANGTERSKPGNLTTSSTIWSDGVVRSRADDRAARLLGPAVDPINPPGTTAWTLNYTSESIADLLMNRFKVFALPQGSFTTNIFVRAVGATEHVISEEPGVTILEWETQAKKTHYPEVVKAPDWLVRRMETLRKMPSPTLEEVETQLASSAEIRRKLIGKQPA